MDVFVEVNCRLLTGVSGAGFVDFLAVVARYGAAAPAGAGLSAAVADADLKFAS